MNGRKTTNTQPLEFTKCDFPKKIENNVKNGSKL